MLLFLKAVSQPCPPLWEWVTNIPGHDMNIIADLMERGIIKSHISHQFNFDKIADAHLQLQTGRTVGKVVVNI